MTEPVPEAVHREPVWRDRSNFVIAASIQGNSDGATEQLWARQVDDHRFEICCIPFFVHELALGDIVRTDADYVVKQVVRASGHVTFRVWFGESSQPRDDVVEALQALGALLEWSSLNLLAVDAADSGQAQRVADLLADLETAGRLMYETGRT